MGRELTNERFKMSDKKSFKIYKEWGSQFSCLDDASAGELIKAIFTYQSTGEEPCGMSPIVAMAFSFIKQQFERDNASYEKTSEVRSEAGKKGGAPKGNTNAAKKQAKTSKNKQNNLEEEEEVEVEDKVEIIEKDTDVSFSPDDFDNHPSLPLNDGTNYEIPGEDIALYGRLYPGIDIMQQIRAMYGWLHSNPKNRKTRGGIKRFITGWLSREQNRARGAPKGENDMQRAFSELEELKKRGELK